MKVIREKLRPGEKLFDADRDILIPFGPRSTPREGERCTPRSAERKDDAVEGAMAKQSNIVDLAARRAASTARRKRSHRRKAMMPSSSGRAHRHVWHLPGDPCHRCGGSDFVTVWVAPHALQCIYCKLSVLPAHRKVCWPTLPP